MDKHECDEEHMDKYECKECGSEDNPPHFDDSEFDGDHFLIAFRQEEYDCGDVAKAAGVKVKKAHQALDDAEALGSIIAKVVPGAPKKQKVPLFEAPVGLLPSGRALLRPRVG